MSTHKSIDRICVVAVILSLLVTLLFMDGEALGVQSADKVIGYENRLFDTSRVHTVDIVMDDWDGFLETCQSEEYSVCSVVIDGESCKNVGIRGKGNTSLSSVASMGSSRYSFKIEFDQYDSTKSYHGLDKLSLNNIIQDNTYMKDYLTYQMMNSFGVDSPLCSFVYITVNGEDWGLYLAVEGVEEAFLRRNYGNNYGELYKPDSMSFGGGRGNGRDFDMNDFAVPSDGESEKSSAQSNQFDPPSQLGDMPDFGNFTPPTVPESNESESTDAGAPTQSEAQQPANAPSGDSDPASMFDGGGFGGGGFSFGSASDVKLQYVDDDPDSYANIFDNAKTDSSDADQARLISSLKSLSDFENLDDVLDIDEVLRYFVVHNFVVNGDSYTGNMIHNYYLYEEDGQLSMIPWDYNLAFGTFTGGMAASSVNDAIDDALSDRPMQAWIFSDESYTQRYHELYSEFLNTADVAQIINNAYTLIADYVEKDPTKFCTYEEFETGVQTLQSFCSLRQKSVQGQLMGTIPSTTEEQNNGSEALIQADDLNLSDMGTMNSGGGLGGPGGNRGESRESFRPSTSATGSGNSIQQPAQQANNITMPDAENRQDSIFDRGQSPENMTPPDGMEPPEGFDPSAAFGGSQTPPSSQGAASESSGEIGNTPSESDPQGADENSSPTEPFGNRDFSPPGGNVNGNFASPNVPSSPVLQQSTIILLAASMLVLAIGLFIVFKYKK